MAPEAYTLKSALDGWLLGEGNEQIRNRAVAAYDKYQKCGLIAARKLIVSAGKTTRRPSRCEGRINKPAVLGIIRLR